MKRNSVGKRAVNLTLSVPLVKRAKQLTDNLSGVVESLLTDFVNNEQTRRNEEAQKLAAAAASWAAFDEEHGSLSDEFSTL